MRGEVGLLEEVEVEVMEVVEVVEVVGEAEVEVAEDEVVEVVEGVEVVEVGLREVEVIEMVEVEVVEVEEEVKVHKCRCVIGRHCGLWPPAVMERGRADHHMSHSD